MLFQEETKVDNKALGGIQETDSNTKTEKVLNGKNGEKTGGSMKGRPPWQLMAYGGCLPCQDSGEGEAQEEKVLGYNNV